MKNLKISEVKLTYKSKVKASERPSACSSNASYQLFKKAFDPDTIELKESMKMLLLNHANRVLGIMDVSDGGTSSTIVDVKMLLQCALLTNANGIIICHNHPSGNLQPSMEDLMLTERIVKACELMGLQLLDHLIISAERNQYYSFADEGQL